MLYWTQTNHIPFLFHWQPFISWYIGHFQDTQTPFSYDVQILGFYFICGSVFIFTECHIQMPMHTFYAPVPSYCPTCQFNVFFCAAYEISVFFFPYPSLFQRFFSIIILFSPFQLFSVPTSEYLPFDNILSFLPDHGLFLCLFIIPFFPWFSIETPYLQNILSHLHIMFPGFLSAPAHDSPFFLWFSPRLPFAFPLHLS